VLIFNQQGHREAIALLEMLYHAIRHLKVVDFDHVLFCPTVPRDAGRKGFFTYLHSSCLIAKKVPDHISLATDLEEVANLSLQKAFAERWSEMDSKYPPSSTIVRVLPSVEDAFDYVRGLSDVKKDNGVQATRVHAFVTGSVHLVGRALSALEGVDAL
jgi:folylpolyglutamate synthase